MVQKFCTLNEAAERLHATQEQIERLLEKGILQEFRDGSHRLLRAADISTIVAAKSRRLARRRMSGRPRSPSSTPTRSAARAADGIALPQAPVAGPPARHCTPERPRTTSANPPQRFPGARRATRESEILPGPPLPPLSDSLRATRNRPDAHVPIERQSLSLRQWCWTGLTQDRPLAIAILSGLVLLALAAAAAGVCALAGAL